MPFLNARKYSDPSVDYQHYAADLRGKIINEVAEMERVIDDYICSHFCHSKDKKSELMEVIIATKHLTFQSKAEIAKCLLERRQDATKKEANKIYSALNDKIAKQ